MSRDPNTEFAKLSEHQNLLSRVEALAARVEVLEALNLTTAHTLYRVLQSGSYAGRDADLAILHESLVEEAKATLGARKTEPTCEPEDTRPAWQRAKVGDRITVEWRDLHGEAELVHSVDDDSFDKRIAIVTTDLRFPVGFRRVDNDLVLDILPPEPERKEDVCKTCGGDGWIAKTGRTPQAAWEVCHDCRPVEPAEPPQDVRAALARLCSDPCKIKDAASGCDCAIILGAMAGAPSRVTREMVEAMAASIGVPEHHLAAALRTIPGVVVEG